MEKRRSKVKVAIRVRPPLNDEDKICVEASANFIEIFNHRNVKEKIHYDFSAVYDMKSSQQQIYNELVKPLLSHSVEGQNVSIFAYGPTGAGKTHTMLGMPSDPGVIPRVINGLFQHIQKQTTPEASQEWKYSVAFSYLEIYNEKVLDLLNPSSTDLPIREDAEKNILVSGLTEKEIHNFDEFKLLFGPASNNRTVAATKLNNRSSRSHSILLLKVCKSQLCAPFRELHGKIYLIDLAGSEDNRRTGNQGIRLKESGAINKSLFALGEVVDAINSGLPRIPYRNSKLTRLLQDSIGGTCHSVMITNIAPEERYYYDTYCTLNLATKSKKIVNNSITREITASRESHIRKTPPSSARSDGESKAKKPKLDDAHDTSTEVLHVLHDPSPLLSPLLRRQMKLEEMVDRRIGELEHNLIKQMKKFTSAPSLQTHSEPGDQVMEQVKQQLEQSRKDLQKLAKCQETPTSTTVLKTDIEPFTDRTNKPPLKRAGEKRKAVPTCRIKKEEEFTCSPLFPSVSKFKKGFKSTASADPNKIVKTENETRVQEVFNSGVQHRHNEGFLTLLNTASVKELQTLQTVGTKRAKLIYDWRQAYGSFCSFEDLKKIPGFTDKYLKNLLHSNLVTMS